jgi:hypothetical protein
MMRVIRYPETTKKTSTPMNPPPDPFHFRWNSRISATLSARRPLMSFRNGAASPAVPAGGS